MQLYERLQTGLSKADAYECLLEIAEGNFDREIVSSCIHVSSDLLNPGT